MRKLVAIAMLSVAACSGDLSVGGDDNTTADGNTGMDAVPCGLQIGFDPIDPVASSVLPIRAYTNLVNTAGVLSFTWTVTFNGANVPTTEQAADGSQINFIAATAGSYFVTVQVSGPTDCSYASTAKYVEAPGANADVFRLRTVPAPNLAPPQETYIQVKGGANIDRAIALDSGISVTGLVKNTATSTGISAYLKFMPRSMPTAYTELFSSATGVYNLRLLPYDHDVLVIPTATTLAPKLVPWSAVPFTTELHVGPGTVVSGTVHNPAGNGFAGAKVQLYAGSVPSTIGTTAADGSFSVRTDFPTTSSQVTVKVTPPASSGLPRLEATSTFNLANALNINYAASLATCNLQNTPVQRVGANQANAQVTVVGALGGVAGTIGGINATNTVRVSATADGTGRLPSMLVPRGALNVVTVLSMTDHAVSAIDTSACSVTQIDAPAMTTITGATKDATMTALPNIRIEAEPVGVLATAGVAPIHIMSNDTTGAFSLPLAAGGRYNVRFTDPQQRAAPLTASNVAPGGVPTNAQLAKALALTGQVSIVNNSTPVIGASVQILCTTCSGLDLERPIAETATNTVSRYAIAVPDPGTM
ncbi:MAG TPA: hypothetical protein VFV99_07255 [Kofleriaceae bacterium]|nr:hypothetical protein [Kofleriaceae bacterium]